MPVNCCRRRYAWELILGGAVGLLAGCSSLCRNTVVSERLSPDGRVKAVVFYRDCGATTPFTTEISVVPAGEDAAAGGHDGNVFSMTDPQDSDETLSRNGVIEARLDWRSSQQLVIFIPRRAVVGKRVDRIGRVGITYGSFD